MKLYTVPEIQRILKIRRGFAYELVANGRLKAIRLSERGLRITEESLKEFLAAHEYRSTGNGRK
ncbi:MAG: helix-turn-helix domain-containing protein [Bacillota bacterium]